MTLVPLVVCDDTCHSNVVVQLGRIGVSARTPSVSKQLEHWACRHTECESCESSDFVDDDSLVVTSFQSMSLDLIELRSITFWKKKLKLIKNYFEFSLYKVSLLFGLLFVFKSDSKSGSIGKDRLDCIETGGGGLLSRDDKRLDDWLIYMMMIIITNDIELGSTLTDYNSEHIYNNNNNDEKKILFFFNLMMIKWWICRCRMSPIYISRNIDFIFSTNFLIGCFSLCEGTFLIGWCLSGRVVSRE